MWALEFNPWVIGFELLALYLALRIVVGPLVHGILSSVPGIGKYVASRTENVLNLVERPIVRWLEPHIAPILRWFSTLIARLKEMPAALEYMAGKVDEALDYLVHTTILRLVHTVTNGIVRAVNWLHAQVLALGADAVALERKLATSISLGLSSLEAELTRRFLRGIDSLRADILDRALPAIQAEALRADKVLDAEIGALGKDLAGIGDRIADLAKRLDVPVALIESLVAAVGVTAAVEALQTLATCRGKLQTLCTSDPAAWAEFIVGLALIAEFPGLREMVKLGASALDDAKGAIRELAQT